jgi:hypothetical protein
MFAPAGRRRKRSIASGDKSAARFYETRLRRFNGCEKIYLFRGSSCVALRAKRGADDTFSLPSGQGKNILLAGRSLRRSLVHPVDPV